MGETMIEVRSSIQKQQEELRKQIHTEFRPIQEQVGLVSKQERSHDSRLAVGKSSSNGFKAMEALSKTDDETGSSTSAKQEYVPGALLTPEAPPPPPPPPHRRPRVREVSSRFMSPVVTCSNSGGDLHQLPTTRSPISKHPISNLAEFQLRQQRSHSVQRRRHRGELEPLCSADENRPDITVRSLDAPLGLHSKVAMPVQRKQRAVKPFNKENGRGEGEHQNHYNNGKLSGKSGNSVSRLDTPIPSQERITSSSLRHTTQSFKRSTELSAASPSTVAVKLLQSSGMSLSSQNPNVDNKVNRGDVNNDKGFAEENSPRKGSTSCNSGSCASSPVQNCKTQSLPDCRSSWTAEGNCSRGDVNVIAGDVSKVHASPCSRSLNFPLSGCCEQTPSCSLRTSEKPAAAAVPKTSSNSTKMGVFCLPPLPSVTKMDADGKKSRKVSSHHEEVHSLRLLHSHYLQWRFANAKSEACVNSKIRETEIVLYSLGVKISDLCESVRMKRFELEVLQRTKALSTVLEAQMPYLDEWSALEGEYSISLSEIVQALTNASLQLPLNGNVKADIRGLGEALNSAIKLTELIIFHVQSFVPKTGEIDSLISALARVIGGAKASVEEYGDVLSKTYILQVEECSLRGQLIQYRQCNLDRL